MLEWVIHDGAVVHVNAFAALPARRRPRVTCPQCGAIVHPKLGRVLQHHAAHSATSTCRVAAGESALHLNLKLHVAEQLRRVVPDQRRLAIAVRCAEPGCSERHVREWVVGWEDVLVEHRLADDQGARVPDIVLVRDGLAVSAIEIVATNAVSEAKERALGRLDVPFVEVIADSALIAQDASWTPAAALPVERVSGERRWRCRWHPDEGVRQLYAARVVDILYPNSMAMRRVYRIDVVYADGVARRVELTCDEDLVARVAITSASDPVARKRALAEIDGAYERDTGAFREHGGAVVDSPMPWATREYAQTIVLEVERARGYRRIMMWSRYPRRYRYVKSRGEWWMPDDMREVTWDREDYNTVEDHPVWGKVREAARERYKPRD